MTRRGRPLGFVSQALLDAVRTEPATVRSLAMRLQLSYSHTTDTVKRLSAAGYVVYGPKVPGQHDRPARVVAPAQAERVCEQALPPGFPFVRWR
jgi:DNA-binding MarR family transcriptional regulator